MINDNDNASLDIFNEMSKGRNFPLKSLNRKLFLELARVISEAYEYICMTYPETTLSKKEDYVTALLERRLNNQFSENDNIGHYISSFTRNSSITNFNAKGIDKQPDLVVNFVDEELRGFPLAIEAKIIDRTKTQNVRLYYKNGIKRFEDGEYSWYFTDGFMIAYVRDGSTIKSELHPYLKSNVGISNVNLPRQICEFKGDLATTIHPRPHTYPITGKSLGPITIWHLWM